MPTHSESSDAAAEGETESDISHPKFAALYDRIPQRLFLGPHRETLAEQVAGRVLEIGAGNGAMFPYVEAGAASSRLEYHAIEPDPNMRERAVTTARETGLAVDIRDARAESLPYPDDAFDVVISGMVFCTVQDPEGALAEVARVLRPGGEFRFLEHVRADGWRAAGQDLLNPIWTRAAGGCRLNRDTVGLFLGHDAFAVDEVERLAFGVFPATPFVRGTLHKRREKVGI